MLAKSVAELAIIKTDVSLQERLTVAVRRIAAARRRLVPWCSHHAQADAQPPLPGAAARPALVRSRKDRRAADQWSTCGLEQGAPSALAVRRATPRPRGKHRPALRALCQTAVGRRT
jgi:hypothetical protein